MIKHAVPIKRVRHLSQMIPMAALVNRQVMERRTMPQQLRRPHIYDILREVLNTPAEFARRIKAAGLPDHKTQLILGLLCRSEAQLIADVRANWYIKHTGKQPIEHDYYVIPDWLLPPVSTVLALDQYIKDFQRERDGITPLRVLEREFTDILTLENPAITGYSTISVELLPEVIDIEDGRLEIAFDRVKKVRVTISN